MKYIKSFFKSSFARIGLFLLTFAVGVSVSAMFLFKTVSPNVAPVETVQPTKTQLVQTTQIKNNFSEQNVTANQNKTHKIVQSEVVNFSVNGKVIVESVQDVGKFPQMVFRSEKTGKVLLRNSIKDKDKLLIYDKDNLGPQPEVRFLVINSKRFGTPMIMAVGIYHGGSDNGYYLAVFGEMNGKIVRLTDDLMENAIQGGYYIGYLNKKFGYGLAYWSFIWGNGVDESHYSTHHYDFEIYQIRNGKFERVLKKKSKKMYDYDEGYKSSLELGIRVKDQRIEIPEIAESLD